MKRSKDIDACFHDHEQAANGLPVRDPLDGVNRHHYQR